MDHDAERQAIIDDMRENAPALRRSHMSLEGRLRILELAFDKSETFERASELVAMAPTHHARAVDPPSLDRVYFVSTIVDDLADLDSWLQPVAEWS